jgi:hypothetical protein
MDPYDVLGVRPDATPEELRRAYVRQARRHHPDRHLQSPPPERAEAERRMRELNQAWTAVSDPNRQVPEPPPRPFQPFDAGDDDEDPRDAPDVPYRVAPPSSRQRVATLTPALLFAGAIAVGILGMVLRAAPLLALGGALFVLSCAGFLVLPLLALGRARHDEG